MQKWKNEKDLAEMLIARGHADRQAVLTPNTALFVGVKLRTAALKPTLKEVVQILCTSTCETPCYACTGKANLICRAYGQSVSPDLDWGQKPSP